MECFSFQTRTRFTFAQLLNDLPTLARMGGHIAVLLMVGGATLLSQARWGWVEAGGSRNATILESDLPLGGPELNETYLTRIANPLTIIPKRARREIARYVVQANDTVSGIAEKFEIAPETILWANAKLEDDPDLLSLGEELTILPMNGVYHTVTANDTVESIAKKYKAETSALFNEWNNLKAGDAPTVGQKLVVVNGKKPIVQKFVRAYNGPVPGSAARGTGRFGWPVSGAITQKFWAGHAGIDIGAPMGTPVLAADSGFVTFAAWDNSGFGNMILIDHRNGFATLYGHLDSFVVAVGDSVKKGQLIGRVGNTGRSTGSHLDFRIRERGVWRNPFGFLR